MKFSPLISRLWKTKLLKLAIINDAKVLQNVPVHFFFKYITILGKQNQAKQAYGLITTIL